MLKFLPSRMTVVVGLAAAIIMAAGVGRAIGQACHYSIPLFPSSATSGENWVSIPYINPYGNAGTFCSQTGLPSAIPNQAQITVVNPCTNVTTSCSCGTAACNTLPLVNSAGVCATSQPGCLAFRIKGATLPSSITIFGSHDSLRVCNVPIYMTGVSGEYWWSVPCNTMAVTFADVCVQGGFPSTFPSQALLSMINPATNTTINASCGTLAAANTNLVLGRGVRIRSTKAVSFIPATF